MASLFLVVGNYQEGMMFVSCVQTVQISQAASLTVSDLERDAPQFLWTR